MENTVIKCTRKAIHLFIPLFPQKYNIVFQKARSHMHGLVADLPQLANSPLTNGGPGKMPVGDVQVTSLSEQIRFRRQVSLLTGARPEWARFTQECMLSAQKIIARYKMRTYVWKLQMSVGLKKVRIKLQLCLKSSILICFWHSHDAFQKALVPHYSLFLCQSQFQNLPEVDHHCPLNIKHIKQHFFSDVGIKTKLAEMATFIVKHSLYILNTMSK